MPVEGTTPEPVEEPQWVAWTLQRLSGSPFRAKFRLTDADRAYARARGRATIDRHAHEMLRARVGAARPIKDGKQTPWKGHPVFTAQHATATCCRGCIMRWHHIPKGRALTDTEVNRLAALVMESVDHELRDHPTQPGPPVEVVKSAAPSQPKAAPTATMEPLF
ncbi:MAG: DUF4186 domain-containing protein [Bifidobacterium castoris]|nr:DUF4186 domain-containing protein [Bifidobacterium castoris]